MDPTSENSTGGAASGIGKIIAVSLATSLVAGGVGGVATLYGPELLGTKNAPIEATDSQASSAVRADADTAPAPPSPKPAGIAEGFRMGTLSPASPIQSVRVTLEVGADGAEWKEPVDLHLGTGFPLRLYPVGGVAREPSFAAFPTSSTVGVGDTSVAPGQTATFEFVADEKVKGLDVLRTTPHLLSDLKVADLQKIGFACQGHTGWKMNGYRVEVNGQLYAEHGGMDLNVQRQVGAFQTELGMLLPPYQALQSQLESLETYVKTGLATDADKAEMEKVKGEIAKTAGPVDALMGKVAGYAPWYLEKDPGFQPAAPTGAPVKALQVTLATGGGEQPGTNNPVYLKAGGRKFLLASSSDPLADDPKPQKFKITEADLQAQPLTAEDLESVGIGLVGNDERFGSVPDRARLQRVVVEADGKTVYDSELKPSDRRTLGSVWLVPPAHLDQAGNVVENQPTPTEVFVWTAGMKPPVELGTDKPPPPINKEPAPKPPTPIATTKKGTKGRSKKGGVTKTKSGLKKPVPLPIISGRGAGSLAGGLGTGFQPPFRRTGGFIPFQRQPVNTLGSLASAAATILNALRAVPTPQGPTLTDILINRLTPIVTDGAGATGSGYTVQWAVSGNVVPVTRYEVRLFGVLPHQGAPLLAPAVSQTVSVPASRNSATIPAIQLSNLTSVTALQRLHLYVRPQVTAVLNNGRRVTQLGSLLPVFPAGTIPANISLVRGPAVLPTQDLPLTAPAGYQLLNSVGATFAPDSNSVWGANSGWLDLGSADTNQRNSAWRVTGEQDSLASLRFATHESRTAFLTPATVHNTALRPAQDSPAPPTPLPFDQGVMIQFDGPVTYNPATTRGFRVVGHAVFLGTRAVASATVNARIRVGPGPVAQDLDGNFVPGSTIPFFSLAQTPVTYVKNTNGSNAQTTALLIDLPYRPDRLANANVIRTAGSYLRDMSNVDTTGNNPNILFGNSQNLTFNGGNHWPGPPAGPNAPFPPFDNPPPPAPPPFAVFAGPFPAANTLPSTVWVTVNIWVQMQTTDTTNTDAVGIMGLRVVPDNTP